EVDQNIPQIVLDEVESLPNIIQVAKISD
ncbi:L-serine ammonia-lyase, iron-sulfur-dependent, subunit beta, partial [Planococcus sp. SIMBA_143]